MDRQRRHNSGIGLISQLRPAIVPRGLGRTTILKRADREPDLWDDRSHANRVLAGYEPFG